MLQNPLIRTPIAISLGAISGALSRYYITLLLTERFGTGFPYGTFFVNLTGCLMMGFFVTFATERIPTLSPDIKLLISTGFLGSYTTFSTYGLDSFKLLRNNNLTLSSFYWLGSTFLGLLCIQLGAMLARR